LAGHRREMVNRKLIRNFRHTTAGCFGCAEPTFSRISHDPQRNVESARRLLKTGDVGRFDRRILYIEGASRDFQDWRRNGAA
jgi:hypothetical protein